MIFFSGLDLYQGGYDSNYCMTHSHIPTYFGIQYNHDGKMRLRVNHREEFEVNGSWAFISHPGAFFEYGLADKLQSRQHYFICFHGQRVQQYIDFGLLPFGKNNPLIKINNSEKFRNTMLELIKSVNSLKFRHERKVLMLEDLLLQLHEQNEPGKKLPAWQAPYFVKLLKEIKKNPQQHWDFSRAATKINITQVHFRRLFKQTCGFSPRQYVLEQRLRTAANLLLNSSALISDIAPQVGIDDIYYFSRVFKQKYTISPLAYRKEFIGI